MNDDLQGGDDAAIERISRALRAPERADAGFEARVMADVRALGEQLRPRSPHSWWLRPMPVPVTPLSSLALAAGIAALAFVGGSALNARGMNPGESVTAAHDTVHVVRFMLADSQASGISLVGSFNQWEKDATPLREVAPGVWTVQLPLRAARHEYAFVVRDASGERWVADPVSTQVLDEFGAASSIIDLTTISGT